MEKFCTVDTLTAFFKLIFAKWTGRDDESEAGKMWQEMTKHKVRTVKIIVLWFVIFAYGLGQGMYGPTLIDLSDQVATAFSYVALTLPCRSLGVIVGATLGGFSCDAIPVF